MSTSVEGEHSPFDARIRLAPGVVFADDPIYGDSHPHVADTILRRALDEIGSGLSGGTRAYASDYATYLLTRKSVGPRIKGMLEKRGFVGRFGKERVVIVDPIPRLLSDSFQDLDPELIRSFIGAVDLISTGRGVIGEYTYGASIGVRGVDRFGTPQLSIGFKQMSDTAIRELIGSSHENWAKVLGEGLKTPYRAGLPGLGRR